MKEDLDKKLNEIARSKYKTSRIEYISSEISSFQTKISFVQQDLVYNKIKIIIILLLIIDSKNNE